MRGVVCEVPAKDIEKHIPFHTWLSMQEVVIIKETYATAIIVLIQKQCDIYDVNNFEMNAHVFTFNCLEIDFFNLTSFIIFIYL